MRGPDATATPYAGDSVQPCGRSADDGEAMTSKELEVMAQVDAIGAMAHLEAKRPDGTGESVRPAPRCGSTSGFGSRDTSS